MIPTRSKRRQREYPIYRATSAVFLENNAYCWCCGAVVPLENRHCHHRRGRAGKLYLDQRFMMMLCPQCHSKVHRDRKWAIAHGFLGGPGEWGHCPPNPDSETNG